jgi:RNA polymerase sigma factor (sigma-70 family)
MDEQRADPQVTTAADTVAELRRYLADVRNIESLYGILHSYVRKAQIVSPTPEGERDATYELLQSVVVKAFELAEKYHGPGLRAWLLSIAQILIKQKRATLARHHQREMLMSEFQEHTQTSLSEEECFELFTAYAVNDPAQQVEIREQIKTSLACLSREDQTILNLNLHYGFNHNEIAHILRIQPVAARVRFYRALNRLRHAWKAQEESKRGDSDA